MHLHGVVLTHSDTYLYQLCVRKENSGACVFLCNAICKGFFSTQVCDNAVQILKPVSENVTTLSAKSSMHSALVSLLHEIYVLHNVHTDFQPTQPPTQWVPGSFPASKAARDVSLTTDLNLAPRPRMDGPELLVLHMPSRHSQGHLPLIFT